MPEISIVIPVFNAQSSLNELISRIFSSLNSRGISHEVILVDDGSTDNSWQIIRDLVTKNPKIIKGIRLARNFGQHNATITGFHHSSADLIVTIDDDLQFDPSSIITIFEKQKETNADVIYGIPQQARSQRNLSSKLWKFLSRNINNGTGEGSSFRIIRKDIAKKIGTHMQPFVFIDEVIPWYTRSINFIKVPHAARRSGKSGYTKRKLITLTGNLIIFYSSFPLKMMTFSGMFLSMVTFLLGSFFFIKKIFFKVSVPGFTALIVTVLFTTSIVLLCLGIIGEYIRRIYLVMNGVPNHHIAEVAE